MSEQLLSCCLESLLLIAKDCVRPGLGSTRIGLLSKAIGYELKRSLEVFNGCRLFTPSKVHTMQSRLFSRTSQVQLYLHL